jgi:membrane-bound inhibitor of C-type lysozyme
MKTLSLLYTAMFLLPVLVTAKAESVSFPDVVIANKQIRAYQCDDNKWISVLYINATNGDSFAYLPIDGTRHIFVTVMSGSGAKYASGPYVWWTKGPQGNLTRGDSGAPPLLANCVEQSRAARHAQ